jgi:hypothetical protein
MSTYSIASSPKPFRPADILQGWWRENAPLTLLGIMMVVALLLTTIGIFADPRIITGQPAWLKPAKFAISIAIYSFSFVWLLTFIKGRPRLKAIAAWVTVITMVVEFVIIALQAARGTTSHFNFSTSLDAALFSAMAVAIVVAWLAGFLLAGMLALQKLPDRALAVSLRMGVIISLIGMAMAFAMPSPRTEQLAAAQAGQSDGIFGAHSVGIEDGGPGLPIVGWSTVGGDYRVAHFLGLHAMQALPLLAFVLGRVRGLREAARAWLVGIGGVYYTGIVFITFWQATRAQSIIAPDELTLSVVGGLTALAAVAVFVVSRAQKEQAHVA